MRLAHPDFPFVLDFNENQPNTLVFESPACMRAYVSELYGQCAGLTGRYVLSQNNSLLKTEDCCHMVLHPFALELNEKKLVNSLHRRLKSLASDEVGTMQTFQAKAELRRWTSDLCDRFDDGLTFAADPDTAQMLKLMDVRFDERLEMDVAQSLAGYMTVIQRYASIRCVILVNIKAYLAREEIVDICRHAAYQKLNLLFIDSTTQALPETGERLYIMDRDQCFIYHDD